MVDVDTRSDLAKLHVQELQDAAIAERLAREARGRSRRTRRVRTAIGMGLVRAGMKLGGQPSRAGRIMPEFHR